VRNSGDSMRNTHSLQPIPQRVTRRCSTKPCSANRAMNCSADSQNKRPSESVYEVLVGGSIRPRGRAPIKEGMAWNEADSRRE